MVEVVGVGVVAFFVVSCFVLFGASLAKPGLCM